MGKYKVELNGIDTNNLKVLSNREMNELFVKFKAGDLSKKEEIINGNLKLVLSLINKYNNGKNDMNDLFSVGCIGLIKAVDNFSLEYNVMFSTYAVPLIVGEIKRFIRESSTVRVSRSIKDLAYKIVNYKEVYFQENGVEPTNMEICKNLGITSYELANALESLTPVSSIYDPIYNDGGDPIYLVDKIEDKSSINNEDVICMDNALKKLNSRESKVLYARYIYGKTQSEIADDLGVSQAQVSRIEKNAIGNIKRYFK